MKKLLSAFLFCFFAMATFAQTPEVQNLELTKVNKLQGVQDGSVSNIPECFCCDNKIFNLPQKPPIIGPQSVSCDSIPKYSTIACPGASISWSISPSIPFTGQGTSMISLTPPVAPGAYTITLTIRCGNKVVTNSMQIKVEGVKNCKPDFTITVTQLTNGSLSINAVPAMLTPGQEHWWGIQYNGTYPNCNVPCSAIPFASMNASTVWGGYINASGILTPYMGSGVTTGTTAYGINYGGFPNNSCFRITHYVKCCGVLLRQTQCVSIGTTNSRMMPNVPFTPDVMKSEIETVSLNELSK
jgi:hypothetical protein